MQKSVAVVGAGVSGLTCGLRFAEAGHRTAIFAKEAGQETTSAVAAAVWFPYDAQPVAKVIPWALETYKVLVDLSRDSRTGVSMIELRQCSRTGQVQIPDWANRLGAMRLSPGVMSGEVKTSPPVLPAAFTDGFAITVPLTDTTIYLDYLANRFRKAGGEIRTSVSFEKLDDVDPTFDVVINCAGIGARALVHDLDLEPHRGQVVVVPKIDNLDCAIVCDDAPLMYVIPRRNDCVFGGTNELSDDLGVDPKSTALIVAECSRVLDINPPCVIGERVGLRPFRRSGVRLERDGLRDGRPIIHNYGHGGSGFTLSWGCAREVVDLARG